VSYIQAKSPHFVTIQKTAELMFDVFKQPVTSGQVACGSEVTAFKLQYVQAQT
jgi:hypothetical protein